MRGKYLATALAGLTFFGLIPSTSEGHRHLAEEYADRVRRERQERLLEELQLARRREQGEMSRRTEEEKELRREEARQAKEWDGEEKESEIPVGEQAAQEAVEKSAEEEPRRVETARENDAAREKERQDTERTKQTKNGGEPEGRENRKETTEEAEETGEGLLRRLMRRAQEGLTGTEKAPPLLHAAESCPMKLLSVESTNTGGTLIFSDSPEYLKKPGILYTDVVKGDARVFYYHLNDTKQKLKVAVVLESVGGQYSVVRVTRQAVAAPDQIYTKVGKSIQQDFFADGQQTNRLYIGPEERRLLLEKPDKTVIQPGELASGMVDFSASAPVRVTVLCYPANKNPLKYAEGAEVLPADEYRLRGTFVGMDRILRLEKYDPEEDGVACVILGDGERDKFSEGVDATDGSLATNIGNYGVLYRIEAYSRHKAQFFLSPMGGSFAGVVRVEAGAAGTKLVSVPEGRTDFGEKSVHPPFDKNGRSTLLPSVDLSRLGVYRAKPPVFFEMSPPGASNLPVLFILAPEDIKLAEGAP